MEPSGKVQLFPHDPVLYHEIIHALQPASPGLYVDATLGAGGHASGILKSCSPDGQLLGLDLDPRALTIARQRLHGFGERAILIQASYTSLPEQLAACGWVTVQGILLDLGVSSMQLDLPEYGFSFTQDGPLDMRFDPTSPKTANDLVNKLAEADLASILWEYGEERHSRQIAAAIVKNRPIHSTAELAGVITRAFRGYHGRLHPATLTFQALRIAVNHELDSIRTILPEAIQALASGGRLAVISFHSLEDRLVKQYFKQESVDCICPPGQPYCTCEHRASINLVSRRPLRPSEEEARQNPRSRSARLRVAEKR